jgi:HSP20 family molecular chaperone IbpA
MDMRYRNLGIRYTVVRRPLALGPDGWWSSRMHVISEYPYWRPDADVVETVGAITVTVELAGVE